MNAITPSRWAIFRREEHWALTPMGWTIVICGMVGLFLFLGAAVHPFLALTDPLDADVLVVEGWLPDYALAGAVKEFHSRPYSCVITTGGPVDVGENLTAYKTYAALCAATLARLGVDSTRIIAVSSPRLPVDRTFAAAIALKRWLKISGTKIRTINLYSLGVHTRRSRLLFQRALGASVPVGCIAARDASYDPSYWWKYSDGVEGVIFESVGYLYVKFLFPLGAEHDIDAE
jgi:hypothetical protein